jgi:pimeloyl-ACP methyl ester carboxylesterase
MLMFMKRALTCLFALLFCTAALAEEIDLASAWYDLGDHRAFLLPAPEPAETDHGKPWVWYAPAFNKRLPEKRELWMITRLQARGIAVAAIDVGESMGNAKGRAAFTKLYQHMVEKGYSTKPVLLGRSRGGLMHYNWAVENPDKLSGIAGIYTVGNLTSWPGLKRAAPAYEMSADELKEQLPKHNPVDRLAPLAKAKVPIYHIHGDNDKVVPLEHNAGLLVKRYKKLDGPATIEVIPGGGHDLKDHWFQSQTLTDFMIEKALGIKKKAKR